MSRPALEGLTTVELDKFAPRAEDHAHRAPAYADVCSVLERVARSPESAHALRNLQREATWSAFQRHNLVTQTRGGMPVPTVKVRGIS